MQQIQQKIRSNMKTIHIYKYVIIFAVLFSATRVFSQETYLLKQLRIPEITQENPGLEIPYDAHVAFPGLGRINVGANLPLSYGDLFHISDNTLKRMGKTGAINTWFQLTPIHFGFRAGRNYFSITTAVKSNFYVAFQDDLVKLLVQGNTFDKGNNSLTFFKDNAISLDMHAEIGLGYNREINDNISFGLNARYLSGLVNVHTRKADVTLNAGEDYHTLTLNYILNGNFASVIDMGGLIDSNIADPDFSGLGASDFFQNHGFAFDIGGRYKINRFLEVEAAVLDIGFINWKSNAYKFDVAGSKYDFLGYYSGGGLLQELETSTIGDLIEESFKEIGDSLMNNLASEMTSVTSYRKWLNTKFNVGVSFYATEHDKFNATFNGIFINKVFIPSGSISYRRTLKRWFDVVIGNTFKGNSLLNPGAGVNFTLGVFQLYTMVDYTNTLAYIDRAKNLNVVFGINFIAHRNKDEFRGSYPY